MITIVSPAAARPSGHPRVTPAWPASVTVTTPAQVHLHWEALSRAAAAPTLTRDEPGVQSPDKTGWQGWGVRVPAAWVAAFTCGFLSDVQVPNGGTFAGPVSVTTPAGAVADTLAPVALNVADAVPKEHSTVAPVHTRSGMAALPRDSRAV
jgi:hypothetical protein